MRSATTETMPGIPSEAPLSAANGKAESASAGAKVQPVKNVRKGVAVRWLAGAAIVIAVIGAAVLIARQFGGADQQFLYFTVARGDLAIAVTERGTIESQENVTILCDVDDIPNDSMRGTPIRWIIPNGSSVTEGQLIVEFESQGHVERLDRQILAREKAFAEKIEADAKFDNQKTQNETLKANAELEVELAKLELTMFKDVDNGTHRLEVEDIKRKIDDINTEILAAKAKLELARKDLHATESLFAVGYAGKSELDRSKLAVLQGESEFASKMNSLRTQNGALAKKETYEKQMQSMTLEGKRATAVRKLIQVKRDNIALLAQAEAKKNAAEQSYKKEEELLNRYRQHVKNCKINAPVSGMIAYAVKDARRFWAEDIRQGTPVNPKQAIMSIPNLNRMQIKTEVHESVVDQIRKGLDATVRMEAFPDQQFSAKVKSVAVLAEQGAETRVYETVLTIDGRVEQLKPGMTAVVEIHINRLKDVLSVPVQAIIQIGRESWCYVDNGGGRERRVVKLGTTNHKFVEIRDGLQEGDRVILNPMSIVDDADRKKAAEKAAETGKTEAPGQTPPPRVEPPTGSLQPKTLEKARPKKSRKKAI